MLKPDTYTDSNKSRLTIRLIEVCCDLAYAYTELHISEVAERHSRHQAYHSNYNENETAKKRIADEESFAYWEEVGRLKAEILDYTEERDLLRFLIGLAQ